MKLLFDFSGWLVHKERGIGRYLVALVSSLAASKHRSTTSIEIVLPRGTSSDVAELKEVFQEFRIPVFNGLEIAQNSFFDYLVVGDFFSSSAWCSLKNLKNCRKITGIVYDLIPLIFANNYLNKNLKKDLTYALSLETLFIPDHLFTISEATKNDLCRILGVKEEKVTSLTSGFSSKFYVPSERITPFEERTDSILMISGDDRRKNYGTAIKGFLEAQKKKLVSPEANFLVVCKASAGMRKKVEDIVRGYPDSSGKVKLTGYIADEELLTLLKKSKLTIFPSKYEGLGLPILESFASGTPCISSNLSSCSELNSKEFTFDPYSCEDIENKLALVYGSYEGWKACLLQGRNLISRYNWSTGVDEFIGRLSRIQETNKVLKSPIALFGCFPPQRSGIAHVNAELLKHCEDLHAFMPPEEFIAYYGFTKNGEAQSKCFSSQLFSLCDYLNKYKAEVFVLGNSAHNLNALIAAIKLHGENAWLYLHEAENSRLWEAFCAHSNIPLRSLYSIFYNSPSVQKIYGLLPLVRITGIKRLIVNNETCKKLVESELGSEEGIRVIKAFHPIDPIPGLIPPRLTLAGEIVIGSFGSPSTVKGTHILFKAVELLRASGMLVKLLIAGYSAGAYFKNMERPEWLIVVDSPSDRDLMRLEKAADIAVQLRLKPHGETSGAISQLIGLGGNIITTEGFVDEECRPFVKEVPLEINEEDLARAIQELILQIKESTPFDEKAREAFLATKSYKSLGKFLHKALLMPAPLSPY